MPPIHDSTTNEGFKNTSPICILYKGGDSNPIIDKRFFFKSAKELLKYISTLETKEDTLIYLRGTIRLWKML